MTWNPKKPWYRKLILTRWIFKLIPKKKIPKFDTITLPQIKQPFTSLPSEELVNVQPLTNPPKTLSYSLRFTKPKWYQKLAKWFYG
jgi:hypothetical protein